MKSSSYFMSGLLLIFTITTNSPVSALDLPWDKEAPQAPSSQEKPATQTQTPTPPVKTPPALPATTEAANLVDNGNGTITDKKTALIWQKQGDGRQYDWYQASGDVCKALRTGGYSDWRLPSKNELITIVVKSVPQSGPTINTSYFSIKFPNYWSATEDTSKPDTAWLVEFVNGWAIPVVDKRRLYYFRCVRAGQ